MCQLILEQAWRGELVRIQTTGVSWLGAMQEMLSPHAELALGSYSSILSMFPWYPGELQHPKIQAHTTPGCVAAPPSLGVSL